MRRLGMLLLENGELILHVKVVSGRLALCLLGDRLRLLSDRLPFGDCGPGAFI